MTITVGVSSKAWVLLALLYLIVVKENKSMLANALETTFNVLSPSSASRRQGYKHQTAEFGFDTAPCPYSYTRRKCVAQGILMHVDGPICNEIDLEQAQSQQQLSTTIDNRPILLVPRGDCSFATTARLVQTWSHVQALVVADHTCLCSDNTCTPNDDNDNNNLFPCVDTPPALVNDSIIDGDTILHIPTVLLPKQYADYLIQTQPTITAELTWPVTSPTNSNDRTSIEYWHVPQQAVLPALGQIVQALSNRVAFTPRFYLQSGEDIGCTNSIEEQQQEQEQRCNDLCTNQGRYCAAQGGAMVVEESRRRMCIWELYGRNITRNDWIGLPFWRYVNAFDDTCANPAGDNMEACSAAAMTQADINTEQVAQCVVAQSSEELEKSLQLQQESTIIVHPTLVVNNVAYSGDTFANLFGAICGSFQSLPDACALCLACPDEYGCLLGNGVCPGTPTMAPTADDNMIQIVIGDNGNEPTTSPPSPTSAAPSSLGDAQDQGHEEEETTAQTTVPPSTLGPDPAGTTDDEDTGGLSDTTKVIIVVAVVGGAVAVIFAVVMLLVWKLFSRIRQLEKKDKKETPTTTSPAGSNGWELPYYVVGKEDPFNDDCEPIPNIAANSSSDSVWAPPPLKTDVAPVAAASDVVPGDAMLEEPAENITTDTTAKFEPLYEETAMDEETADYKDVEVVTSGTTSSSGAGEADGVETTAPQNEKDNESISSADPTTKTGKAKSSPRARPRRRSKDPTLIDIMGRAAPEAKFPRRFSYDDEEKEEIEEIPVAED
ncbi:Vacuolar-sorting receptor [Seminavis robusta]|uniref:Vacuolar-sorting receptor n=1 Tax=Seminavis robusta TaxID=568900 RepID=A0A9N8D8K8_9STRA|nr:Vacuolar-sorting receptor [Seminavis robusta]|eukprot:Sro2_g001900.1 Vacuolar-sorting receptor (775) ;mRNA; f:271446-273926